MTIAKAKILSLLVILVLVGCSFVVSILGSIRPYELNVTTVAEPTVIIRSNDFLCTGVTQIVSDEKCVYVLFGNYSVIQAYTRTGDYLYSISVYNYLNGRTEIATKDNLLYICDKIHNIYVFDQKELVQFIDSDNSSSIRRKVLFGVSDKDYLVKRGSIWFAPTDQPPIQIIKRPYWLMLYQDGYLDLFRFACVVVVGIILFWPHRNNVTGGGSIPPKK